MKDLHLARELFKKYHTYSKVAKILHVSHTGIRQYAKRHGWYVLKKGSKINTPCIICGTLLKANDIYFSTCGKCYRKKYNLLHKYTH